MTNLIMITVDGARTDFIKRSILFQEIKSNSVFSHNCITYAPHTIAAMHAIFSGTYGSRNGTNSYWSTYQFKKNQFKTLTEYLKTENYTTIADLHSGIVIPKQGFDEFQIFDEYNDDLILRHSNLIEKMKTKNEDGQNFFLYLQFSNIHTGISTEVLQVYDNFSEEYFQNKKLNEKRYDELFKKSEF